MGEKKPQTFVCCNIFEKKHAHKTKTKTKKGKDRQIFYTNIKFVFHSWYTAPLYRPYFIATDWMTFRSPQTETITCRNFIESWEGGSIDDDVYDNLSVPKLLIGGVGKNCTIYWSVVKNKSEILRIEPHDGGDEVRLNSKIVVPQYLRPVVTQSFSQI